MTIRKIMTKTNWKFCQSLDGTWWYEDTISGAKLPPGLQPICKFPGNHGTIKIHKINLGRKEDGD